MARNPFLQFFADLEWRESGACRGQITRQEIWFPDSTTEVSPEARAICAGCIVQEECLDFALKDEGSKPAVERNGIWGGKSRAERAKMWRERNKKSIRIPIHVPEVINCKCGCTQRFDAWRTIEGKPRRRKREFATRECQLDFIHRKQTRLARTVVCKLNECHVMFQSHTTFAGTPTTTPRVYCGSEHQRLGVRETTRLRRLQALVEVQESRDAQEPS